MEAVTKTVILANNERVQFARLDLEDLFGLTDELLAEREAVARKLAKEENLDRYEVINLIADLRNHKPTVPELLANCATPQGAALVLRKSLNKSKVEREKHAAIISQLNIPDCIEISRLLILDVQEKPAPGEEKKAGEESPLSESPSTSAESKTKPKGKKKDVAYYGMAENAKEPATTA